MLEIFNSELIYPAIYLLFGLALVMFFAGIVQMMMNSESDQARVKGRQHMIWGVIGMFIMVGVIGILNIIIDTISSLR